MAGTNGHFLPVVARAALLPLTVHVVFFVYRNCMKRISFAKSRIRKLTSTVISALRLTLIAHVKLELGNWAPRFTQATHGSLPGSHLYYNSDKGHG